MPEILRGYRPLERFSLPHFRLVESVDRELRRDFGLETCAFSRLALASLKRQHTRKQATTSVVVCGETEMAS